VGAVSFLVIPSANCNTIINQYDGSVSPCKSGHISYPGKARSATMAVVIEDAGEDGRLLVRVDNFGGGVCERRVVVEHSARSAAALADRTPRDFGRTEHGGDGSKDGEGTSEHVWWVKLDARFPMLSSYL
jgi:hypothetical protein